jgi:hypothetical protein
MSDYKSGFKIDSNILGLALIYSVQLTGLLQWTVRVTIETENNMTAVERLNVFKSIEQEKPRITEFDKSLSLSESQKVIFARYSNAHTYIYIYTYTYTY